MAYNSALATIIAQDAKKLIDRQCRRGDIQNGMTLARLHDAAKVYRIVEEIDGVSKPVKGHRRTINVAWTRLFALGIYR